jgi:hypothetical protein
VFFEVSKIYKYLILIKYSGGFVMNFALSGINPAKTGYYGKHLSGVWSGTAGLLYQQNFFEWQRLIICAFRENFTESLKKSKISMC